MSEDEFEPKIGRMRATSGKSAKKYAGRVIVAARLIGATTGVRARRFDGSRIGRGASMGRLLSSGDRLGRFRARRAVVKTRLVRLGSKGLGSAQAHLRYIQRDGVTREGSPGELYSPDQDQADGKAFLDRSTGDRHQFRFIASAEDGAEYPDLKPYVRRLMAQVEADLGTKLDWVAVDHFNTERPHTHIMLRGVDDRGENLIIAREYIAHGLRERAAELVTLDLGPRTTREIEERLRHDVGQERLTAIDRRLLHKMTPDRIVTADDRDPFQQSLRAGRLRTLQKLGLADDIGGGRWQLADNLEGTLRRMGERGDIIRTMQREFTRRNLERSGIDAVIADPDNGPVEPVVGRVIHRGFSDELHDRHHLLLDGVDGHVHYVEIGRGDLHDAIPEGTVVRVAARATGAHPADHVVANVAAANDGRYSVDLHLRDDPSASQDFAEAHVRRLEALRRANAGPERDADGTWRIAPNHVAQAETFEKRQRRDRPVDIDRLSAVPIKELVHANAATWLDWELASPTPVPIRDAGFGREVRAAVALRQQWLVEQQLADASENGVRLRANALATLQRRELLRVAGQLTDELSKPFVEAASGDRSEGKLVRRIEMLSGRFALIEKSREFTLAPWRPALENRIGKAVSGIVRGDGVSWQFGRGRSGPTIS
jgi:type IV secretory pathway VirD2 relaxase